MNGLSYLIACVFYWPGKIYAWYLFKINKEIIIWKDTKCTSWSAESTSSFCIAYIYLVDAVDGLHTVCCSLQGWTTRGWQHSPVSECLSVWPLWCDFSLLFCEKWSGFYRVWLSFTQDGRLKVSKRLGSEDKVPRAQLMGRGRTGDPRYRSPRKSARPR